MKRRALRLRKRRRINYLILTITLTIVVIFTYLGYLYVSNYNSRVMKSNVVDFIFILGDHRVVFVRDSSPRRIVYLVIFPPFGFDGNELVSLQGSPENVARSVEKMLKLEKADGGIYHLLLSDDSLEKLKRIFKLEDSKDFPDFVEKFSKRGFKFLDLLKIIRISRNLGSSGNVGKAEFLRFFKGVGSRALLTYEVEGLTPQPITIKVGDREYRRIYLSPESLRGVREVIK